MALVKKLEKISMERNTPHGEAGGTYTVFSDNGKTYLQIDTNGSAERKIIVKKSQSLQFGPEGLKQLREILDSEI